MYNHVAMFISRQKNARKRYFDKSGEEILSELISKKSKQGEHEDGVDKSVIENNHKTFAEALEKSGKLNMCTLKEYNVPAEFLTIQKNVPHKISVLLKQIPRCRTSQMQYINAYTAMVHLEEAAQTHFLAQFNTNGIQLKYSGSGREFCIKKTAISTAMAAAVEESLVDSFTLSSAQCSTISIAGQIRGNNKDNIFVQIDEKRDCEHLQRYPNELYDIHFHMSHINRVTFQIQHFALEWIVEHDLFDLLVSNPKYDYVVHENDDTQIMEQNYAFCGTLASNLNEEQKAAAINIVKARNAPLPYLLFGPAGTGKTRTLVAAIEEIVRSTSKAVLVCANSNSACDEITERLLSVLHFGEMFRIYAKSYDVRKISGSIKPICNWVKDDFRIPSLDFLYQFRVLICTLSTAGYLSRATEHPSFDSAHFSHLIIDESASTHETVTMIPIAGLCTTYGQINSSIVLAGDPKQLDAVTKSRYATKLGFKTSFMEHLFEKRLYKRDPITGQYNRAYTTHLVKNYRSHPAILYIPNMLFYDNKLQAKAPEDKTNWYIGSNLLPSKNFPIVFKTVQGICKKSEEDFSLFNIREVDVVIDCIRKLLATRNRSENPLTQSDIGVVTPYKLQCKIIAQNCRRNGFNDITIGTAEVFQGQERPVMIVSTVRTDGILGFVKEPRRLNVVITRAKCLLVIVGDADTLRLDENWGKLIDYCARNNALTQPEGRNQPKNNKNKRAKFFNRLSF